MRKLLWCAVCFNSFALSLGLAILQPAVKANSKISAEQAPYTTWKEYGGTPDDAQYSALNQIDRTNVSQLKQVWFYPVSNTGFRFGSNPIIVDNVMYVVGSENSVVALDAATGKEIWTHPSVKGTNFSHRGLVYWESKDRSDRRILYTSNNSLWAIDARTGNPIPNFGDKGSVDLRTGLGRDPKSIRQISSGTPGKIFGDLLLMGSATGEDYESPPGDLRAFNVVTGKLDWSFHTVASPGRTRIQHLAT